MPSHTATLAKCPRLQAGWSGCGCVVFLLVSVFFPLALASQLRLSFKQRAQFK